MLLLIVQRQEAENGEEASQIRPMKGGGESQAGPDLPIVSLGNRPGLQFLNGWKIAIPLFLGMQRT